MKPKPWVSFLVPQYQIIFTSFSGANSVTTFREAYPNWYGSHFDQEARWYIYDQADYSESTKDKNSLY